MTADAERRCALASRRMSEDIAGTASRAARWLLLEQPGPWGETALLESRLDVQVGRTLQSAARRHGFKALLVRRPGWRAHDGAAQAFLAHARPTGSWMERLDVEDPRELAQLDWGALGSEERPGIGEPVSAPLHLVCTNGKHDACCADHGRPVVRALHEAGAPDVWESSHVGGDRFAANVVCLPHGAYFGRVAPDEAVALVEDFRAGLLHLERYRGRSCYGTLVQAAEIFARRELGERRLDALIVARSEALAEDRRRVTLDHEGRAVHVVVQRIRAEEQQPLTCGAATSAPWRYQLIDLVDGPDRPVGA